MCQRVSFGRSRIDYPCRNHPSRRELPPASARRLLSPLPARSSKTPESGVFGDLAGHSGGVASKQPKARQNDPLGEAGLWDVVIVGGGAAGLSAALILAQAKRAVLVVDAGEPRNRFDDHMHGYLSRDGLDPKELVSIGRDEAKKFGAKFVEARAVGATATKRPVRFQVQLDKGANVSARRLLVATGLRDELPDIDGIEPFWGSNVFHCPYCSGCEVGGKTVAILACGPESIDEAHLMLQYTDSVVLLTDETIKVPAKRRRGLASRGVSVVEGKVAGATTRRGKFAGVIHADGTETLCDYLLVSPKTHPISDLLDALGVKVRAEPDEDCILVPSDDSGLTAVPGVYVAGNVRDGNAQVIDAAAQGLKSAIAINADLVAETVKHIEAHAKG